MCILKRGISERGVMDTIVPTPYCTMELLTGGSNLMADSGTTAPGASPKKTLLNLWKALNFPLALNCQIRNWQTCSEVNV